MDVRRNTLQFRIELREIEPAIWRRLEIRASCTFWDLHVAIQDAMGWLDYHLHAFRLPAPLAGEIVEIGIPDPDRFEGDPEVLPGWEVPVTGFLEVGDRLEYEYDFGDSWLHDVRFEAVGARLARTKYPRCLAGARACPPEDCGGPHGYADLLTTIAHPRHPEYASTLQWLGGSFDPEKFDPRAVRFDDPRKRWRVAFGSE
jgi:hypothetical protein